MIIDFSAHDTWDFCPAKWYELYINKRRKRWPKAQRDDALALGSLVHEGLRMWQQKHIIEIPAPIIEEVTPSLECLNLAQELVYGYSQAYPQERWPLIFCEQPLTLPLLPDYPCEDEGCPHWGSPHSHCDITLLAKIDTYFYVPELTQIESGVPGLEFTLNPGWWIHEYKTKSPRVPLGIYMQSWEMGLQASYQVLALQHHINHVIDPAEDRVQGILINVLEKPEKYVPKRKCPDCEETSEFATWLPTGTGLYACPVCGKRKELKPLKEITPVKPGNYYRVLITREADQLAQDREMIIEVGQRMIEMQVCGLHSEPWHKKNCADMWWKRACDYFGPHRNGVDTREDEIDYMDQPEYRGLIEIEGGGLV